MTDLEDGETAMTTDSERERARAIVRPWVGPLGLDDTQEQMLCNEIFRAIEQAEADGISRGVQRASIRIEKAEREARKSEIEELLRELDHIGTEYDNENRIDESNAVGKIEDLLRSKLSVITTENKES